MMKFRYFLSSAGNQLRNFVSVKMTKRSPLISTLDQRLSFDVFYVFVLSLSYSVYIDWVIHRWLEGVFSGHFEQDSSTHLNL